MVESCTVYLPIPKVPLKKHFPGGRAKGARFWAPTIYTYDAGDGVVRLKPMAPRKVLVHLDGFGGFINQLPDRSEAKARARELVEGARSVITVEFAEPVAPASVAFAAVLSLVEEYQGFMLVQGSVMLPDGRFVVGPLARGEGGLESLSGPRPALAPHDFRHQGDREGVDPILLARREKHYLQLAERGLFCDRSLPLVRLGGASQLRLLPEIAARLTALEALFLWGSAPEEVTPADALGAFVERNLLRQHLTEPELAVLDLPRDEAQELHTAMVADRLEAMWMLAWILGFEPAPPWDGGTIPSDVTKSLVLDYLPFLDGTVAEVLGKRAARSPAQIEAHEDLFFCAENAVERARQGEAAVPPGFDPDRDGDAIRARRHALIWALSPGVAWDDPALEQ